MVFQAIQELFRPCMTNQLQQPRCLSPFIPIMHNFSNNTSSNRSSNHPTNNSHNLDTAAVWILEYSHAVEECTKINKAKGRSSML
mmetsp:Transcript_2544/g.5018  ORF Transcript_2544/g.5018 Transcript_2544/m.5018 type:complete len:85 (-) Transcript_2544:1087-1341(-)